jgi:mannose-6-phosphate isomerase-like protein (cupin superfamily)
LPLTLLADIEPIAIAEVRAPPGSAPPPAHVHLHGEGFYVLAGELTFCFDDREVQAGPRTWVFVPPNVAHTFFVSGAEDARFLDLHAPSCGFGNLDQTAAPEGGGADPVGVLVRTGTAADAVEVSGNRIAFLADAEETGGVLGAIEFTAPQAFAGPPAHVHRGFHDIVFVLEGTLDVRLADRAETAGPGALVLAPPGVAHTFANPSDAPLRFLNLYVPGGFERFFRERAAATAAGVELTSRYDWERA